MCSGEAIPRNCKRLAEVEFPFAVVSEHAAREKSIRHGHPSTLHLWWARRPLASSRAVLLALLLPDPCDPQCPDDFKRKTRAILGELRKPPVSDEELRKALLWFIGAFASDLNPVACLILTVMLEDVPRRGAGVGRRVASGGR